MGRVYTEQALLDVKARLAEFERLRGIVGPLQGLTEAARDMVPDADESGGGLWTSLDVINIDLKRALETIEKEIDYYRSEIIAARLYSKGVNNGPS